MALEWSVDEAGTLDGAEELDITTQRADGTWRGWVPIWVVCVGERAFVRTWHRRENGWFGRAVAAGRARIRVPGLEADVAVVDLEGGPADLHAQVSAAYRAKYARYGADTVSRMTGDDAVASTLQLLAIPATNEDRP